MTEIAAKRPNSKRNLDMAIRRLGKTDEDFIQARTIMANAIVAQMIPSGAVKGGYALKLRFGNMQARATVDLDAARACELDAFMAEFEKRLVSGWEGFEGRVVPRDPAQPEGVPAPYVMMPFDVKLSYLKSPWCTVPFELGHNEIGDADEPDFLVPEDAQAILSALGFPSLSPIPVMPLHHQIAQKIHALSTPGSKRAHDLIDLQLIVLNNPLDYGLVKTTC